MGESTILRLKGEKTFSGVKLYCQSKVFEDFWRGQAAGEKFTPPHGYLSGREMWKWPGSIQVPEYVQYREGESVMKNGGCLAFTRCVGIETGLEFTFEIAVSNEILKEFLAKTKALHSWIIREYGGKICWDIEISSSEKIWCSGGSIIL